MIDQTQITKYPIYGTSYVDRCIWKINDEKNVASICLQSFNSSVLCELTVVYSYETIANTINEETAKLISKKEFYSLIRKIKNKYNIEFTIK